MREMSKVRLEKVIDGDQNSQNAPDLWAAFCERFRREVGDAIYFSWFKSLELEKIVEGIAYLSVPTKFLRSWIQAHYLDKLRSAIVAVLPSVQDIVLEIASRNSAIGWLRGRAARRRGAKGSRSGKQGDPICCG